ncbi:Meckel syndrome type 1 protein homolog [Scaptodrosophila lebanonensis]|uniref:Meckel syndrome type 1 protein homolog n=1 Tax=Drosophila lebanonensis TaxID=7225 RepID=A0A6J2TQQ7_DROLE|nr:Meckel syndrome type 1 protein homolog [Scaptodrosophila lebanonensis]
MYKASAVKRTGIYRVTGNIADFQMELKLRHISEWLPVPKFEYTGAQAGANHKSHYPDSSFGSSRSDFFIFMPFSDEYCGYTAHCGLSSVSGSGSYGNGFCSYYNYYNPSNGYPTSSTGTPTQSSGYDASNEQSSNLMRCPMSPRHRQLISKQSSLQSSWQKDGGAADAVGDSFYAQNRELCNGGTANMLIGWQQKHFSRQELARYREASNCVTTLQRRYHRWTQDIVELQERHEMAQKRAREQVRIRRKPRKTKSLKRQRERELEKTRVRGQEMESERTSTPLRSLRASASPLLISASSEGMQFSSLPLSEFSLVEDPNFAQRTCLIHTLIDADSDEQSEEALELRAAGFQVMYVYADLQPDTLLITIKYSPTLGLLFVYPDFNFSADDMDYIVEVEHDCRQLYSYGFQSVIPLEAFDPQLEAMTPHVMRPLTVPPTSAQAKRKLRDLLNDPTSLDSPPTDATTDELLGYYRNQRLLAAELRTLLQFAQPPKRTRRVVLLLELHEAQHFEYANIHVRYYIHPPPYTILEPANPDDPFPLRGATQTSLGGGAHKPAHFSHCWQLTLLCEEQYDPEQLLHIYFEVISVDSWQRERCEGYTHFSCSLAAPLPAAAQAGQRLQCIRPLGSWWDAINRYFIGGRKVFDFVGYFNVQQRQCMGALHTRLDRRPEYGTRSTGVLLFSVKKLQQRSNVDGHWLLEHRRDGLTSPSDLGLSSKSTLDEVLAAYVEARERVETLLGYYR